MFERRFWLNFLDLFESSNKNLFQKKPAFFYGSFVVQANHWGSCEKPDPTKPQHCLKKLWWGALPWVLARGSLSFQQFFSSRNVTWVGKKRWKKIMRMVEIPWKFEVQSWLQNKVDCFTICSFLRQKSDFRRHNMTVSNLFIKIHLSEINAKSRFGAVVEKTKIWVSLCWEHPFQLVVSYDFFFDTNKNSWKTTIFFGKGNNIWTKPKNPRKAMQHTLKKNTLVCFFLFS